MDTDEVYTLWCALDDSNLFRCPAILRQWRHRFTIHIQTVYMQTLLILSRLSLVSTGCLGDKSWNARLGRGAFR